MMLKAVLSAFMFCSLWQVNEMQCVIVVYSYFIVCSNNFIFQSSGCFSIEAANILAGAFHYRLIKEMQFLNFFFYFCIVKA